MELRSGQNPSPNPDWTIRSGSKPGLQPGNPEPLPTPILGKYRYHKNTIIFQIVLRW
jgi:hypothetical protein